MRPAAAIGRLAALDAAAEAGFGAVELPVAPEERDGERLAASAVALAGVVVALQSTATRTEQAAQAEATLDQLMAAGAGSQTVVLLVDATADDERQAAAGQVEAHRYLWTRGARLGSIADAAHRAAERARDRDLQVAYLPRPGTPIETPREIEGLAEALDPDLVALAFDVEGWRAGGGDPQTFASELGELTRYVRIGADVAALVPLRAAGYTGWVAAAVGDDASALAAARERLAEAGLE